MKHLYKTMWECDGIKVEIYLDETGVSENGDYLFYEQWESVTMNYKQLLSLKNALVLFFSEEE
jgi:hypothetical protein